MPKRALITGVNGQDGSYLAELLVGMGYRVIGLDRTPPPPDSPLRTSLDTHLVVDLMQSGSLESALRQARPDELYCLAAHHFSSQTNLNRTGRFDPFLRVNLMATCEALELIATELPHCRVFYPASCQVFGAPASLPQDESTPRNPDTPYAITKNAAMDVCRHYRTHRGVFVSVGILYNHESPRRDLSFVTSRIARAAATAFIGSPEITEVRDLDAVVDWGAAQDYVRAMWLMLQQRGPDDFVIASGIGRTVREFAETAFSVVGLEAERVIVQMPRDEWTRGIPYVGAPTKIRRSCGWEPAISFADLVRSMVEGELQKLGHQLPESHL